MSWNIGKKCGDDNASIARRTAWGALLGTRIVRYVGVVVAIVALQLGLVAGRYLSEFSASLGQPAFEPIPGDLVLRAIGIEFLLSMLGFVCGSLVVVGVVWALAAHFDERLRFGVAAVLVAATVGSWWAVFHFERFLHERYGKPYGMKPGHHRAL